MARNGPGRAPPASGEFSECQLGGSGRYDRAGWAVNPRITARTAVMTKAAKERI